MPNNHSSTWFTDTALPFGKSLGIVLVFSPWLIIAYSLITSHSIHMQQNDQDAIRGFIEWFGTAYSFFLGLALVNVWSQFDTVDREFDRELDAVSTLFQTVECTQILGSDPVKQTKLERFKKATRQEIKDYVTHVSDNYKFEHRFHAQHRRGDRILESISRRISTLTCEQLVPEPFIEELFKSLNEAMDVRGDRISHSEPYTPVVVQVMAVATSIIWLFSFLALVIYDRAIAIALVGGAAFVIIMVLVIFFDLGEPFGGIWKIHLKDWPNFLKTIDHDNDPEVIFIYKRPNTMYSWFFTRPVKCKLDELAHSKASKDSWEEFWKTVPRAPTNKHPRISCRDIYCNQVHEEEGVLSIGDGYPLVVLKRASDLKIILDSQQINSCEDMDKFSALFHKEMKKKLRWY